MVMEGFGSTWLVDTFYAYWFKESLHFTQACIIKVCKGKCTLPKYTLFTNAIQINHLGPIDDLYSNLIT